MARGPRRGLRLHRARDQHPRPDVRHGRGSRSRRPRPRDVGAVILELARSEQTYTYQRPIDYATSVLAGAIAAGWQGPVFLQGDHYQFNAKKYAADPEAMTEEIRRACRLAIDAGYRNIDIDASTLVDLSPDGRRRSSVTNYERAAEMAALIRIARGRRRDDQHRRRDRRGRQGELDRGGAARLPRRLAPRARATGAGRRGRHLQGQRPDRHVAWRRAAARTAASPRSKLDFGVLERLGEVARASTASPAPCSTARRPCPTSCSTASRRSRPPRSTSRPASRTLLYEHPAFPAASTREIEAGASPTRSTSGRPARPTSSSSTRRARRHWGRSSAQLWDSRRRTRSSPPSGGRSRSSFTELGVEAARGDGRQVHPPGRDIGRCQSALSEAVARPGLSRRRRRSANPSVTCASRAIHAPARDILPQAASALPIPAAPMLAVALGRRAGRRAASSISVIPRRGPAREPSLGSRW